MRIFGLPHAPENASILEHDLAFITSHFWSLFSVFLKMVTWFSLLLPHWFWIDNECNFRIKSIKFNESFWEGPFYRPFSRPLRLKNSLVKSSQFWTWLWTEKQNKTCQFSNCWLTAVFKLLSILSTRLVILRQFLENLFFREF